MIELKTCPRCDKTDFGELDDVEKVHYVICNVCGWTQESKEG